MKSGIVVKYVRLLLNKRKEPYALYKELLGFYPFDIEPYNMAMLNRSSLVRDKEGNLINNERLEYLGDAILEAIVTDELYHNYPKQREGFLTILRSRIVQRKTLNNLGTQIGLPRLMKSITATRAVNIYGNTLEALIGAIYLDRGYEYACRFVKTRLLCHLDIDKLSKEESNTKVQLLEWGQKNKYDIRFDWVANSTPHRFTSHVYINGVLFGQGSAYNKKEAQQRSSADALGKVKNKHPLMKNLE